MYVTGVSTRCWLCLRAHHIEECHSLQPLVATTSPKLLRAPDHRPWQLPGAAHIFPRQGLSVIPIAAEPFLAAEDRSGIALCETAGSLTYQLWGRL